MEQVQNEEWLARVSNVKGPKVSTGKAVVGL